MATLSNIRSTFSIDRSHQIASERKADEKGEFSYSRVSSSSFSSEDMQYIFKRSTELNAGQLQEWEEGFSIFNKTIHKEIARRETFGKQAHQLKLLQQSLSENASNEIIQRQLNDSSLSESSKKGFIRLMDDREQFQEAVGKYICFCEFHMNWAEAMRFYDFITVEHASPLQIDGVIRTLSEHTKNYLLYYYKELNALRESAEEASMADLMNICSSCSDEHPMELFMLASAFHEGYNKGFRVFAEFLKGLNRNS
jgi:hypothetical protein